MNDILFFSTCALFALFFFTAGFVVAQICFLNKKNDADDDNP